MFGIYFAYRRIMRENIKKKYVICSDIGGSGTKTMLFDLGGEIVCTSFKETKLYHPEAGATIQLVDELMASVVTTIRECLYKSNINKKNVEGIIFDGQQSGLMWIDQDYNAVSEYDSWIDMRCGKYVPEMIKECGDIILNKTGTNVGIVHGPKILWWKNERPEIYKKAYKMVLIATYIGGKFANLNGKDAYYENTTLGFSGIADIEKCQWDREICESTGIDIEKLPEITEPEKIIGKLCSYYAMLLELTEGIPVISGGGDFPCAGVGAGILNDNQLGDIAGTASIVFVAKDSWKPDPSGVLRVLKSPVKNIWYTFGFTTGGGGIRWFRDNFFNSNVEENIYDKLSESCKDIPSGCSGLGFYPYIGGTQPNPDYRGAWIGIDFSHSPEHFYKSILEGIAYEYKGYLEEMKNLLIAKPTEMRIIGGGSASIIWNQIKANVLGLPCLLLSQQECSLLGSAIIAGYALGYYESIDSKAKELNKTRCKINPEPEKSQIYEEYYKVWRKNLENKHFLNGLKIF